MEELIFFAVIIVFSVLESIARSRRAKQGGGEAEDGGLPDSRGWEAESQDVGVPGSGPTSDDHLPTYDADPSYDDRARQEREARGREREEAARRRDGTLETYRVPRGTDGPTTTPSRPEASDRDRPSSETMLPGDLLEQLEALARGRQTRKEERRTTGPPERTTRPRTIDLPRQPAPLPAPIEEREVGSARRPSAPVGSTAPVGSRRPIGATPVEHEIHRAHTGYGTDPSGRARSEQDGLDPLAERMGADAVAVRRQLLGGGRATLRQAMVLKEVLGPPRALRDEGGRDW